MRDSVYTHDFSDAATWYGSGYGLGASAWVLEPPPGMGIRIISSQAKTSVNVKIHSPLQIWFQARKRDGAFTALPPQGADPYAYCVTYDGIKDWVRRGNALPTVSAGLEQNPDLPTPVMMFSFQFEPCPMLWSTRGFDENKIPKWGRMVVRIADNQTYRDAVGAPIELAVAKYDIEYFRDVEMK